jgi:hypothetical protein
MTEAQVKWYVTKLAQIPNLLDRGAGEAECVQIGKDINDEYGMDGMVQVCEHFRDNLDAGRARAIEHVWGGIGDWYS